MNTSERKSNKIQKRANLAFLQIKMFIQVVFAEKQLSVYDLNDAVFNMFSSDLKKGNCDTNKIA